MNKEKNQSKYDFNNDGIDHINIYSKGKTELGKLLTNFNKSSFTHPEYGYFANMECFWHYVSTGMKHNNLKKMPAFDVKKLSKDIPKIKIDNFMEIIKSGIHCKLTQNPSMLKMFMENELPLDHYYLFGTTDPVIFRPKESDELIDIFDSLKKEFKETKSWLIN